MPAEALAALAAILFATSHIAAKRGAQGTSVPAGLLISLSCGALMLGGVAVALRPDVPSGPALVSFAAAGLLAPGVARAGAIAGVHRLGASVAVPIQTSVYPLVAVAGAAVVLGESIGPARVVGVVAIVTGLWILSRRGAEPTAPDGAPVTGSPPPRRARRVRRALAFPFVTGIAYGGADLVRSGALDLGADPIAGALTGLVVAVAGWLAAVALVPALRSNLHVGPTAPWFAASGAIASCALMTQFHALAVGDVSVVSPIVACQPLVVLLLAGVLLRGVEELRPATVGGALATVAGAVLVAV